MSYNGWTNYETWLTNLHFDGVFPTNTDGETIKNWVEDTVAQDLQGNLFAMDMINTFLGEVNWDEIASHYVEDSES